MTTVAARPELRITLRRAWTAYALTALGLMVALAGAGSLVVSDSAVPALWFSAGVAYVLQLIAFAGLVAGREQPNRFLAGWLLGMALRFGVVGGVAWWLSRSAALPREAALVSLVGFVFLLLLLEPVFLRWDKRKT
jgi:hypothetical protein